MQISSRFTIALHTLLVTARFSGELKVTSNFIGSSVGVNPVIIRRTLGQLKEAGIVAVEAGVGGASLVRDPAQVTLLDVFRAVESVEGPLFSFHERPNPQCPVGRRIHPVLDGELLAAQRALEDRLAQTTLQDLIDREHELEFATPGELEAPGESDGPEAPGEPDGLEAPGGPGEPEATAK